MEFIKNKLKFKAELPLASLQALQNLSNSATSIDKAQNKPNKTFKHKSKSAKIKSKPKIQQPQKKKTSQKILPYEIKQMLEYLHILRQKHPITFPSNARPALKKGITRDIASNLNISHNMSKRFMYWYTTSSQYLVAHKPGSPRYDLSGNIITHVSHEEFEKKTSFVNKTWELHNNNNSQKQ
jgi:hypothetical protein